MSALPENRPYTVAEYDALLGESDIRHEYVMGDVFAMTGSSEAHIIIGGNIFATLLFALRDGNCFPYNSEMRVHVQATGSYFFPDVTVVCGEAEFKEDAPVSTLLNPRLIVEVLSPSTELRDRTTKLQHYLQIPSLQDYILVAQEAAHIERYSRGESELWTLRIVEGLDTSVELPSLQYSLALKDVYERVHFPPQPTTLA